jgi:ADP-heptose:LPS heptosyltransferase
VSAREQEVAAQLLPAGRPWVALHAGAGDPRRRWAADRFAAVADGLCAAGIRPVLVGSGSDVPMSAVVCRHAKAPLADLTGRTDLGTLAAVFGRCAVVVANDSGPLHLARAVGAATVGLYWCGNAINAAPPGRTRHRPLLSWIVHCPVCGLTPVPRDFRSGEGCADRPSFLDQILVVEVLDEVLDLVSDGSHPVSRPATAS